MFRPPPTARTTVLITGAAGFVGSALADRLRADGHHVRGLDLPTARRDPGDWIAHDLTTPLSDRTFEDVDLVVHCAALAGVQASWSRPLEYWRANVLATRLLRNACERTNAPRVIAVSSSSVYGAGEHHPESAKARPLSPYGRSKLEAERAWTGYPKATVVRLSNVYGPGQRADMAYATFIRRALDGRPLELRDGGRQLRTPTFIDDCVEGLIAAATHGSPGAAYNIAGPEDVQLQAIPLALERLLGHRVQAESVAAAPGDPREATVSIARARGELGFSPRVGVYDGLSRQLAARAELAATA